MNTRKLILCALFAALTAILSQIAVPLGAVPFNLATFSVLCAGTLLGAKYGALSQIIYILLGVTGVPVFAGFKGGAGVLAGPTGGYIIGYAAAAFVVGIIIQYMKKNMGFTMMAMIAGFFTYMSIGTVWYMFYMQTGFVQAIVVCVIPFLIGDGLKIAMAAVVTRAFYRIGYLKTIKT